MHCWTQRAQFGDDPKFDVYLATGNNGQKIFVRLNLGMAVVFAGSHYGMWIGRVQPWQLPGRFILLEYVGSSSGPFLWQFPRLLWHNPRFVPNVRRL